MFDENPFPDYQPKLSPDTIHDYIGKWSWHSKQDPSTVLEKIPEFTLGALKSIIMSFIEFKQAAAATQGTFVDGNMLLGAPLQEYIPSAPELIVSEIGKGLIRLISSVPRGELRSAMVSQDIEPQTLVFTQIEFSYADVMGSGRFFYAHKGATHDITIE